MLGELLLFDRNIKIKITMKLKYLIPLFFIALFTIACSDNDDDNTPQIIDETEGLTKVQELTNDMHTLELYTVSGNFHTGYNSISIRIKNNSNNTYVENADFNWIPIMEMPTMSHSCPFSNPIKTQGKSTLYNGYIIYQMTNSDGSGWSLTLNYIIDGTSYTVTDTITVLQSEQKNTSVFAGTDDIRYIVAFVEPTEPIIGINDLTVGVYKMETMMSFPLVENYTLTLDPRMPDMGNHSSPNNTDLNYSSSDTFYHGNLSLTMTGYWKLNLKLLNSEGDILKGEDVTEENESSSLYLDLEF